MKNYAIRFKLLLPRHKLLRVDMLPFLLAYVLLAYAYFQFQQDENISLYLRLTTIAISFTQCLTYIFGHWSKRMQAYIQYRTLQGTLASNLMQGSHVYVIEQREGEAETHGIVDYYVEDAPGNPFYFFTFQHRKFYFSHEQGTFVRLRPYSQNPRLESLLQKETGKKQHFDPNILEIPIRPFWSIFREQMIDPFTFFQLFSVFLWMLDENRIYCLMILAMLFGAGFGTSVQRIKTLVGYRSMTLMPHDICVYESGKWVYKSSYELLPGDIVAITAGSQHKQSNFAIATDAEYLAKNIPFARLLSGKLGGQSQPQKNNSHRNVSCDLVLLSGSLVVNESILTGQAIPQIKECVAPFQLNRVFEEAEQKSHMVLCGTEVLQVSDPYDSRQIGLLLSKTGHKMEPPPMQNCCIALVFKTGFDTSKGKLIRRVLSNTEHINIEQKDGLWIILFLLVCSLITSAYVLDQGMLNAERSKEKLFLRCIMILTTVVPPELPMILTLAVNNSILYLQKNKIYVSEPKKIPLGGKVSCVAFDKTGTLTEDKFTFEGIVDDCVNFTSLKTFKSSNPESQIVLAGCHSLVLADKELAGDPIELMFFALTDWSYTSKTREARRVLERVTIHKVYPFKSELKRMSTLAEHVAQNGTRNMKILTKGAPEALEKLLIRVPAKYTQAYAYYTQQGFRLLTLASKVVDYQKLRNMVDIEEQRAYAECDLEFVGFFICNSPLKEDTLQNIQILQKAAYNLLIITGDNVLTANKVAVNLKFASKAWLLEGVEQKIMLDTLEGTRCQITSEAELASKLKSKDVFLSTSTACSIPPSYYKFIKVFARTSPSDKELIVKTFKQTSGGILYAGDGTNDVGGLRIADVGVAVVGTSTKTDVDRKEQNSKKEEASFKRKLDALKSDPTIPVMKKYELMMRMNQEMMRKRANQSGAGGLFGTDEIKVGDACIAAPFTSKHSNSIKCVVIIIRQAVATLVTTIQSYKILAINALLQAYALAEMNLTSLKYSEKQLSLMGILAAVNYYYFTNSKPLKRISHVRAPNTIFTPWFAISFFGQIAIYLLANYYALNQIGLKYVLEEDKHLNADAQFQPSFVNTVIFLFVLISQSTVFIVNHGGEPHMESLLKNSRYFKFLVIPLVVCFVLTANLLPDLSTFLNLKFDGIPFAANIQMLFVFGALVSSTYFLDRLCRFRQYREVVGWL